MLKRLLRSNFVLTCIASAVANYLRFVKATSSFVIDPPDLYERMNADWPVIVTVWHGQHLVWSFTGPPGRRVKALISRRRDGELAARIVVRLGLEPVRGSGSLGPAVANKGGATAFREMIRALEEGCGVAVTGDVPKIAHKAALGVILLAQKSGRPIYPAATVTSRYKTAKSWDRTQIPLPFGRIAVVIGPVLHVDADADEQTLEAHRRELENILNAASARAAALAEKKL